MFFSGTSKALPLRRLAMAGALSFAIAPAAHGAGTDDGKRIYEQGIAGVPACASCHGARGEGQPAANFPYLAGQGAEYLEEQLRSFADGSRGNAIMKPIAAALDDGQRQAVAAYVDGLKAPWDAKRLAGMASTFPDPADQGAWLANRGDWGRGVPACTQCHAAGGAGVGGHFPAIAGLPKAYIIEQFTLWRKQQRPAGPLSLMGDIALRLDEARIEAVAGYFADLPEAAPRARPTATSVASPAAPAQAGGAFTPPPATGIPDDEFGKAVRKGQDIFLKTGQFAGEYVGNSLNCASCHMDAGRQADASPLWAAYVLYPAYRSKNKHVNTLAERLQGCFQYSMNGRMPPADSETIVALESYMYWLATGAPTGKKLPGQGFPRLDEPERAPDYVRGQKVFEQHCALCHGADGAGRHDAAGAMVFPALWGDDSYNWGAGMHGIDTAAAFIKANMPLSQGNSLTDQEAWDVSYFVNAHERPQDPRYKGDLRQTTEAHHGGKHDLYGREVGGVVLGAQSTPPGGTLRARPDGAKETPK